MKQHDKNPIERLSDFWERSWLHAGIVVLIFMIIGSGILTAFLKHIANNMDKDEIENSEQLFNEGWETETLLSYVDVCNYKDLVVKIDAPEIVSDYDVEIYVDQVLKNFPEYKLLDKMVVDSDSCANIDIIGVLEDDTEPCLEEKGVYYIPGQSEFLTEIEKALIGRTVGDTFEVEYIYPDNFADAEYSGKKIIFTVKVNGIYEQIIRTYGELDDAFAKNVLKCRSKDEFLSQIKTEMYSVLSEYEETAISNAVINKVISESVFNVPDSYYEEKYEQDRQLFINYYCSGDESQYDKQIYNYSGYTADEYRKKIFDDFKKLVNYELAAMAIASDMEFTTESEDYRAFVETQKESYGNTSIDNLYKLLTSEFESGEEYLRKQYYMYTVTNYLCEHVKVERTADATVSGIVFENE